MSKPSTKPVVTILFDHQYKQWFYQSTRRYRTSDHCPFCGVKVTGKNFAGAGPIRSTGELRIWDNCAAMIAYFTSLSSSDSMAPSPPAHHTAPTTASRPDDEVAALLAAHGVDTTGHQV
jgi:hypothetical protein